MFLIRNIIIDGIFIIGHSEYDSAGTINAGNSFYINIMIIVIGNQSFYSGTIQMADGF